MTKIDLNKLVVIDIETLCNCFTLYAKDVATGAEKQFIIFDHKQYEDQTFELFKFLRTCVRTKYTFVTFNGLFFDMPILDYFFNWCLEKEDPLYELDTKFIIEQLYQKAQEIINLPKEEQFKANIPEGQLFLPTIDLYKQKHFDRKKTSLKWVEFTMRFPNIEEMPIPHDEPITIDQIPDLISYNRNDVIATYEFYKLIKFETEVRLKLSNTYKVNLINAAEPRLGREIFATILAPKMGISYSELKQMRTVRKYVAFKDIIFPYVKFVTPVLQNLLIELKKEVVDCNPHAKEKFKKELNYNGLEVQLGLGGIHACVEPGVYVPAEDEIFEDSDGKSYYPKIAIENGLKPEHFKGETFSKIYNNMYEERQLIPKEDPINYVYKIILNSIFGLSSEINSYYYDKKLTYGITINGQLMLIMLAEALTISVPDVRVIQMNTDGVSYIYKKKYQSIVERIWAWWQQLTGIELEHNIYSKMVIIDVNNYMAVDLTGKVKKKGRLETKLTEYNKNPSHLIIPKAIEQYFINNIPLEETIHKCDDIYDFCGALKQTKDYKLNLYKQLGTTEIIEPQQKVTRYIVSNNKAESGMLFKDYFDKRKVGYLANTLVQPMNVIPTKDASHYKINHDWYIKQARDIVEVITPRVTQTTLF